MFLLLQIEITRQQFIYYGAIAGATLGFLLGIGILIFGLKRNKRNLGIIGLISSTLGGAISGLLAIIIAGIFIWLIMKKPETIADSTENHSSADISNVNASGSNSTNADIK